MGNSYGHKFFEQLIPYLKNIKSIQKVILNDIFTTRKEEINISLKHLNLALSYKDIRLFDLSNNAICPEGCLYIKEIFTTNPNLKHLYFNHSALS